MELLYLYHRKIILLVIALFVILSVLRNDVFFDSSTFVICLSFFSSLALVYSQIGIDEGKCTKVRLFSITFIYSFLLVSVFLFYSYNVEGNTFLLSETDSRLYEKVVNKMLYLPYKDSFEYLFENYKFDDWGGPIYMSSVFRIYPDKLFLNFVNTILTSVSSLFVFKIGDRLMSRKYAYLSALSYAISSFMIFFNGSFLKESSFVFFVILLINSIYNFIIEKRKISLIYIVIYSCVLLLFRPAVVVCVICGFSVYYFVRKGYGVYKLGLILLVILFLSYLLSSLLSIFNQYTLSGDIAKLMLTKDTKYGLTREMTYTLNWFGSFFGPFPSILGSNMTSCFYGSGLLYKFLLLPFAIIGLVKVVKLRIDYMFPLLVFFVLESFFAALVQKGMELRLTLPHIFIYYIFAFWTMEKVEIGELRINKWIENSFFVLSFIFVLCFNVLRQ